MAVVTRLELKGRNGLDKFDKYPIAVNIPVSLNYNLADVRNPDQRKASFSKTINLNGTNEINKLFENIFSVNVATQYFNKNLKTPVRYIVNEIENFAGDLQLIKININPDNSIVYECSIIGAGGSLFVDIGEKYITGNANSLEDLDFSTYDHNYTRANQIGSRTTYLGTGTGYTYPFIDRGTNGNNPTVWNVKDFLPIFSVYEYIKKIIEGTGRTFTSTFLNSSFFKRLYCYANIEKLSLTDAELANKQFYIGLNTDINVTIKPATNIFSANTTLFPSTNYIESTPFFDAGGQVTSTSIVVSKSGFYNVATNIWFEFLASAAPFPSENRAVAIILRNGIPITTYGNTLTGVLATIVTQIPFAISSGEIYLNAGDVITVKYDVYNGNQGTTPTYTYFKLLKGSGQTECNLYLIATRKEITEGDPLAVNRSLPTKIKQKEFLTSILKAFNLFVEVNPNNPNDLLIEPFDEFYNTTGIVDYENRTDLGKEQTINPNLLEGKRYIYTYKADKDYYNDLYLKTHNEVFGTEEINVDNDFIKSDKKTELIFSATPLAANYELGIAMPKIYTKDETSIKTIAPNIRLLYCAVKTSPNAYTYKQQGEADITTNEYLHAGMEDDALNPTVSLMFGPAKEFYYNYINAYFTTNTLYNKYHKQYLVNLIDRDAKFVTKFLWLTPKDINEFSFRNRLFIDGSYYIVNKIENYTPLEQTSTKVELIKLLDTEAFVPESILISDSSVDAGADIYNSRLNSSLNVGTNIQNRGTNCLAIGENIVIPESCTNLIVFGSNITADENSTGLLLNYKSYVALLTQSGTAAPTAIVLENTLGEVTFTYISVGNYDVVTSGLFNDKTFILMPNSRLGTNFIYQTGVNTLRIVCRDITSDSPFIPFLNNALNKTSIEIRVYN